MQTLVSASHTLFSSISNPFQVSSRGINRLQGGGLTEWRDPAPLQVEGRTASLVSRILHDIWLLLLMSESAAGTRDITNYIGESTEHNCPTDLGFNTTRMVVPKLEVKMNQTGRQLTEEMIRTLLKVAL